MHPCPEDGGQAQRVRGWWLGQVPRLSQLSRRGAMMAMTSLKILYDSLLFCTNRFKKNPTDSHFNQASCLFETCCSAAVPTGREGFFPLAAPTLPQMQRRLWRDVPWLECVEIDYEKPWEALLFLKKWWYVTVVPHGNCCSSKWSKWVLVSGVGWVPSEWHVFSFLDRVCIRLSWS